MSNTNGHVKDEIIASSEGGSFEYINAPRAFEVHGVLVDVIDKGMEVPKNSKFGNEPKHKILLGWQLEYPDGRRVNARDTEDERRHGKRYMVWQKYTLSLGNNANLTPVVQGMMGRALSADEKKRFNVVSLIGTNCIMDILHKRSEDGSKTFVNIDNVQPFTPDDGELIEAEDYMRKIHRDQQRAAQDQQQNAGAQRRTPVDEFVDYGDRRRPNRPAPQPASGDDIEDDEIPF